MFLRAPSKIKIKLSPLDCYLCLLSAYFCILHKGYALSDFRVNFKEILLLINPTLLTITWNQDPPLNNIFMVKPIRSYDNVSKKPFILTNFSQINV